MIEISLCMIVKNEEANIERAIRSFLPFADEIIVNDTFWIGVTPMISDEMITYIGQCFDEILG